MSVRRPRSVTGARRSASAAMCPSAARGTLTLPPAALNLPSLSCLSAWPVMCVWQVSAMCSGVCDDLLSE